MTFIPGCERDVFISYAHDNDHDGWVTRFQKSLAAKLTEYLGAREKPSIWFDNRNLKAGDPVSTEIHQILDRTAAMVSIITPSYLSSVYCLREELEHFWSGAQRGRVIIQAVKVPLRPGQHVPLPDLKYVEFLDRNDAGELEELDAGDPRFARTLNKVASQLGTHLEEMRRTRQAIVIAEPIAPLLVDAAQQLRTELHGHGYRIADERVAAFTPDGVIRDLFEGADLSIHFVTGGDDAVATRQFDIARSVARPMLLLTLEPLASGSFPAECGIPVLVSAQGNPALLAGDWKQRVLDQVRHRLQPPAASSTDADAPLWIYVYCSSKADLADAQDLMDACRELGCDLLRPDFRIVEPERRRQDHEAKLARADAVILFGVAAHAEAASLDAQARLIAECPSVATSRVGVHALDETFTALGSFVEAARSTGRARADGR